MYQDMQVSVHLLHWTIMTPDASHQKRALRAELRERRQTMTSSEREAASLGISGNLEAITVSFSAHSVACYLSAPFEPQTRDFLRWASHQGIRTLLPVSREDGLLDWTIGEGEEVEGLFGCPEITGTLLGPIAISNVDLIFVPAAAVDLTGVRLGWGRGYFDKTIGSMEKYPPAYAVVFDHEVLESVPQERHDQPVDGVVTPTRILNFSSR
jgi:5-formyltetrahydrofolate cyclo-ligase